MTGRTRLAWLGGRQRPAPRLRPVPGRGARLMSRDPVPGEGTPGRPGVTKAARIPRPRQSRQVSEQCGRLGVLTGYWPHHAVSSIVGT
jgi:hypothetical protein